MTAVHYTTSITLLADAIGIPSAAIRLLITLFAGYPISAVYRCFIAPKVSNAVFHHIYFALCGFSLCFFNYGIDTYHSLIGIWITFIFVRLLHRAPKQLLITNFIFHMSYLLLGYYYTASNEYDILWTMPQCVLTLRMIGFGFDVADGTKPTEKLSIEQKNCAMTELPTLLELTAFAYFPSSFLVGPQFPFLRYKRFINGEFKEHKGASKAGLKRLLLGLIYLTVRQLGSMMLPDDYFLTDEYSSEPLFYRLIYLGLWAKFALYKYIACWLITEGALMCIGFTYNGKNEQGEADWNGCSNVKLILLETGNTMGHYVHSFNVNTNQWVSQYIYKRLKFLNNRTLSYAAALGFLAVWHGFHSGYYMAFFIEYSIVSTEKEVEGCYKKIILPRYGDILNTSKLYKLLLFISLKTYNLIYMGWCLTPFIYLSYNRWIYVMQTNYYFGFVYIAVALVSIQLLRFHFGKNEERKSRESMLSQKMDASSTVKDISKED